MFSEMTFNFVIYFFYLIFNSKTSLSCKCRTKFEIVSNKSVASFDWASHSW